MPLSLVSRDVSDELESVRSVLIVSCPVCPQVSLALEKRSPLIQLFKSGLKTVAFEDHIREIREPLEQRGVRTGVCTMYGPVPTMCLWTRGQRNRLRRRARDYEAVLVLGCESAVCTAQKALEGMDCRVVSGMQVVGITNAAVKYRFPMTLELEDAARISESREDREAREATPQS
ncbi:MAG: hypothetical protein ACR2P8_13420 [Myxococcota bacterium]